MDNLNFSKNIFGFKTELKHLANYIKAGKKDIREGTMVKSAWGDGYYKKPSTKNRKEYEELHNYKPEKIYQGDSYLYRHMHIAYCLLRGRTMEQIENKVAEGNEPNNTLINKYAKKFMGIDNYMDNIEKYRKLEKTS